VPLYDYDCPNCGYEELDFVCHVDDKVLCDKCGRKMNRRFPFTHGINMGVGAYGYYDENLETYVATNKQRREEMKKQGVIEGYGKGWY
jgi:putative FmdB family regulatory protein